MNDAKYIGLDVHQATISATVLDSTDRLVASSSAPRKSQPSAGSTASSNSELGGPSIRPFHSRNGHTKSNRFSAVLALPNRVLIERTKASGDTRARAEHPFFLVRQVPSVKQTGATQAWPGIAGIG